MSFDPISSANFAAPFRAALNATSNSSSRAFPSLIGPDEVFIGPDELKVLLTFWTEQKRTSTAEAAQLTETITKKTAKITELENEVEQLEQTRATKRKALEILNHKISMLQPSSPSSDCAAVNSQSSNKKQRLEESSSNDSDIEEEEEIESENEEVQNIRPSTGGIDHGRHIQPEVLAWLYQGRHITYYAPNKTYTGRVIGFSTKSNQFIIKNENQEHENIYDQRYLGHFRIDRTDDFSPSTVTLAMQIKTGPYKMLKNPTFSQYSASGPGATSYRCEGQDQQGNHISIDFARSHSVVTLDSSNLKKLKTEDGGYLLELKEE